MEIEKIKIPEIDLEFTSVKIEAKTRKLKVKWTPEIVQDLSDEDIEMIIRAERIKQRKEKIKKILDE